MKNAKWYRGAAVVFALALAACATEIPLPTWDARSPEKEAAEYAPFLKAGTGTLSGQAFLTQRSGAVIPAAGREVTLDPVTPTGIEYWKKAGTRYVFRDVVHPSANFQSARKTILADASGRFVFSNLPAGKYFVRTIVTWDVPSIGIQGGLLGERIEVKENQTTNLILNHYPPEYTDLN